ncbi:patatin-like phospholipase family protein [bacterium]|nr:patatin-like phospholipase family protein [bacterium]
MLEPSFSHRERTGFLNEIRHSGKRIALVLSGGGARGLAHIGVLRALDEQGIKPDLIVGTSMGAVIGGLYAAGYSPEQMKELAHSLDWREVFKSSPKRSDVYLTQRLETERYILSLRFRGISPELPKALSPLQQVFDILSSLTSTANWIADGNFDNLAVPFRAVAVDILSGRVIVFDSGNLAEAIRASISLPVYFSPVSLDTLYLVDGGLLAPIPTEVAESIGAEIIIASDVATRKVSQKELSNPVDILTRSLDIMSEGTKRDERKLADILITPDLDKYPPSNFDNCDSLIEAGHRCADSVLRDNRHIFYHHNEKKYYVKSIPDKNPPPLVSQGEWATLSDIQEGLNSLYKTGKFSKLCANINTFSDTMRIVYHLVPLDTLRRIKITGVTVLDTVQLHPLIDSLIGKEANLVSLQSLVDSLISIYHKQGFTLARVSQAELSNGTAYIGIDEGTIEAVEFLGNEHTRSWTLEKLLPFHVGEVYNENKVKRGVGALYGTELFDNIYYYPEKGESGVVLKIRVVEKPHNMLKLAVRYDDVSREEIALEFLNEDFLAAMLRFRLGGKYGVRDRWCFCGVTSDRIGRLPLYNSLEVGVREKRCDLFHMDRIERHSTTREYLSLRLGSQVHRLGTLYGEFNLSFVTLKKGEHKEHFRRFQSIGIRSIVDTYNDIRFPTKGRYHTWYFKAVYGLPEGDYNFTQSYLYLSSYYTFLKRLTARPIIEVGITRGFPPFYECFSIGEPDPFWGYRFDYVRAENIVKFGLDLRLNLPYNICLLLGTIIGDCYSKEGKPDWNNLRFGVGAGVGVSTLVGPIKLMWGKANDNKERFYISAGYDF